MPIKTDPIAEIASILRARQVFLLATHGGPDGDAAGSGLALALALKKLGKEAVFFLPEPLSDPYRALPGVSLIRNTLPGGVADVLVALDAGDFKRFREDNFSDPRAHARLIVNIDHHSDNDSFGDLNYVDVKAAACGEQIHRILGKLSLEPDRDISQCLFTAIMFDTGSFRYANTTADTFQIASELVAQGADPAVASKHLYFNKSFSAVKLLGRVLDTLQVEGNGRILWAMLSRRVLAECGAQDSHAEKIIEDFNQISGADIALFFRELKDGKVKVSMRSARPFCVNTVAARHGGGGHKQAAGCTIAGPLNEVKDRILLEAGQLLAETPRP
ncbi:MAG: DHH family phosphoesterase [Armatimonadetes bacterium]|nr:DHH family phosphoesterase [Armatimonadota bacterium]